MFFPVISQPMLQVPHLVLLRPAQVLPLELQVLHLQGASILLLHRVTQDQAPLRLHPVEAQLPPLEQMLPQQPVVSFVSKTLVFPTEVIIKGTGC